MSILKTLTSGLIFISTLFSAAYAFDRETTNALKTCHDYLWEVPKFADLPNAAISVWPASQEGNLTKIFWNVNWTDPDIRAAGQCEYADGEVIGYEEY